MKRMLPDSDIHIEGIGDSIMLVGSVSNQLEAQQASDLAAGSPAMPTRWSTGSPCAAATR